MSYEEVGGFSDSPEFDSLRDAVVAQLFEINGQIGTIQQFVQSLDEILYRGDRGDVQANIVDKIDKRAISTIELVAKLIKDINGDLQKVECFQSADLNQMQQIAKHKVLRDVSQTLTEFSNVQKNYKGVIKAINDKAKELLQQDSAARIEEDEANQNNIDSEIAHPKKMLVQREALNNEEFAYQQHLIQQRDEEIANIEQGIKDLNEVFVDLGNVIQQQGALVDNIESNIYSTVDNTAMASQQLRKAMNSQRRSSKWCFYLLIILMIMLFFMILIVLI